jgi:hypothetical protein
VAGYRGIYQDTDGNGNTVYVPVLKVSGVLQDLGSFPTPQVRRAQSSSSCRSASLVHPVPNHRSTGRLARCRRPP